MSDHDIGQALGQAVQQQAGNSALTHITNAGSAVAVTGGFASGTDIGTICAIGGLLCAAISCATNVYRTYRETHK